MAWDKVAAEAATRKMEDEFDAWFAGLSEEQKQAVRQLRALWAKWYNGNDLDGGNHATGHKALARKLLNSVNNPK